MFWERLLPPEMPAIKRIKREEWCKDPVPNYETHDPARVIVHHSWKPTAAQFNKKTVESIYNYHVYHNGWLDIGYHFLISPDGRLIYVGRPANVVGAHINADFIKNTGSVGICLIGNYDEEKPSRQALYALSILIFSLCEKYNIKPDQVFGHCEGYNSFYKSCPGKNLFIELFGENRWEKIVNS